MGAISFLQSFLVQGVGSKAITASTGGGANAKAAALLPLVVGSTGLATSYPANSAPTSVPLVVFGTTSGITTVLSSGTLGNHMLVGMGLRAAGVVSQNTGGTGGILQVFAGAVGSEVLVASACCLGLDWTNGPKDFELAPVLPPIQWPINERVSARIQVASGTTALNNVFVNFMTRPI